MTRTKSTLHRDGTVTYWSVYDQQWVKRAAYVPPTDLAAMSMAERDRVMEHVDAAFLAH